MMMKEPLRENAEKLCVLIRAGKGHLAACSPCGMGERRE